MMQGGELKGAGEIWAACRGIDTSWDGRGDEIKVSSSLNMDG